MSTNTKDTAWAELQSSGAAGLVGDLLQRSAQERDSIHNHLVSGYEHRIAHLERLLEYWEPLGRRYLSIRAELSAPMVWPKVPL